MIKSVIFLFATQAKRSLVLWPVRPCSNLIIKAPEIQNHSYELLRLNLTLYFFIPDPFLIKGEKYIESIAVIDTSTSKLETVENLT